MRKYLVALTVLWVSQSFAQQYVEIGHGSETPPSRWTFVVRANGWQEVWRDESTKILWSDKLLKKSNYRNAVEKDVCNSDESAGARGNLTKLHWRIPSEKDWDLARMHWIVKALPNMNNEFLTSSPSTIKDHNLIFNGAENTIPGNVFPVDGDGYEIYIRCIADQ